MKLRQFLGNKFFLGTLILVLAGGGWWAWQGRNGESAAERYRTDVVAKGDVAQIVSANGTLNPVVLVSVGTQVSGTVKRLYVNFNDRVQAGQVLAELDDALNAAQMAQSSANLASSQASLELAKANEARMQALFKQEYVSRQELDQSVQALKAARAAVSVSLAQVQRDRTNLAYAVIRSPVSGVVVDRTVDVGQTVAASFQTPTLFKIAQDLGKMQIDSSFAEADVGQIRAGMPVRFRVDAFPNREFQGTVRMVRLNPTTLQNVVTYDVVVGVDNPDQVLLPGMTAYVNIQTAQKKDTLLVPNGALRFKLNGKAGTAGKQGASGGKDKEKSGDRAKAKGEGKPEGTRGQVHVLDAQGQPKPVNIRTGITDNRYTEVLSGDLKVGDQVVVEDTRPAAAPSQSQHGGPRLF
jgi:HlyD family secretion protein